MWLRAHVLPGAPGRRSGMDAKLMAAASKSRATNRRGGRWRFWRTACSSAGGPDGTGAGDFAIVWFHRPCHITRRLRRRSGRPVPTPNRARSPSLRPDAVLVLEAGHQIGEFRRARERAGVRFRRGPSRPPRARSGCRSGTGPRSGAGASWHSAGTGPSSRS